ncbi:hypothetical protein KEM48_008382 [Puccinia striiformis f. sp. tritici PST-130]|nr:hypothetical protein KEM48_008382 [Puccinia striiformis f. sp. tritici PST-130]
MTSWLRALASSGTCRKWVKLCFHAPLGPLRLHVVLKPHGTTGSDWIIQGPLGNLDVFFGGSTKRVRYQNFCLEGALGHRW